MPTSSITAVITTISPRYLERQLAQVSKQVKRIIVCSDRDDRDVLTLAEKYCCEVILTNGVGQGRAREIGVSMVDTEFVHVIDDDDWLLDDFYPSDLDKADVWFTNSIWALMPGELRPIFANKTYVNISCHLVRTSVMRQCLAEFREFENVAEDHFYYEFFSRYTVDQFEGRLMRIMLKGRRYEPVTNTEQKERLIELINKPCKSNNANYEELLNDYKTANRYGLCTLFNA